MSPPLTHERERGGRESTKAYLFKIHSLHRALHPPHHARHAPRNLPHRHRRLHPARDGIYPRAQAQQVQFLILLPYRVLGVDFGDVGVVLLYSLHVHGTETRVHQSVIRRNDL